jgi:NRPS condensation-like uncharacterized protein
VTTVPFGLADELSCYYDTPAEPCNVHVEVRVPGHLDEPALRRAAHAALAAQPRAVARRAQGGRWQRRYAWELPAHLDTDPVSAATWTDEGDLAQQRMRFLAAAPPLEQSPPLRLLLAAGPGEARVILNAHHAALDGISCLELLRAVAAHYAAAGDAGAPGPRAGAVLAAPIPARPADPDATGTGSAVQATPPAPGSHGGAPGPAARFHDPGLKLPAHLLVPLHAGLSPGSWKVSGSQRPDRAGRPGLLPRPAARIAADRRAGPGRPEPNPRSGYGFKLVTFPRVPAFPEAGREPRVTVNDLLIAALIVAIDRWNAAHGQPSARIRITMPVNSRPAGDAGAAGNLSRLTAVTAQLPGSGYELPSVIADVARQTRRAKQRTGPQVDPLIRALAAPWCPAAVKRRALRLLLRTAGPLFCDTSLLSNLGAVATPPAFGHVPASHLWFSTSAHMPRGLSVGAVTVGGQLNLCLRYRRALFSEPAAARFTDGFTAALSQITSLRSPR